MTEQQKDKIKGVIYGQAIGDALGLGTEFMSREEIKLRYPDGLKNYSQIYQDEHRRRWKPGAWTDDTDQALCIIDTLLESGSADIYVFARHLKKWLKGNPMGIGNTVLAVLTIPQFEEYPLQASNLIWKLSDKQNAANGAIMRTSVLGVWEFWNREKVIANTELICKVTHYDPRCVGSCVIITSVIAELIDKGVSLDLNTILKIGSRYDHRIAEYIELSRNKDIESLHLEDAAAMGYTLKALAAALWVYRHAESFEDGLLKIISQGGDADSNAAVACSVLGAKFGFNGIPKVYVDGLIDEEKLNKLSQGLIHRP